MNLDIHIGGEWRACAQVHLIDPQRASRRVGVWLQYDTDYALDHLERRDLHALTVHALVNLGRFSVPHWASFLIDLLPQGAARKRLERLATAGLSEWELLERGATNPVGNVRVRPHTMRETRVHSGFDLSEMVARGDAFIDYAHEVGATVAGATDTQGEAPKFWVIEDENGHWHPDPGSLNFRPRRFALLKFPVPEAGARALDILRHEAAYQQVAKSLGLRVTPELPRFIDGALLIPRFDRRYEAGKEVRLGVESLYSIAGVIDSAESALRHHEILIALAQCLTDFENELLEYIRRDLLNIALGNRDNHGRNTAILKETDGSMRFAPLYDLGPAFLDARAITRVIHWEGENAQGTDWNRVLELLRIRFEEAHIAQPAWTDIARHMRSFASEIERLPALMLECDVDENIIEHRRREIESLARSLHEIKAS